MDGEGFRGEDNARTMLILTSMVSVEGYISLWSVYVAIPSL